MGILGIHVSLSKFEASDLKQEGSQPIEKDWNTQMCGCQAVENRAKSSKLPSGSCQNKVFKLIMLTQHSSISGCGIFCFQTVTSGSIRMGLNFFKIISLHSLFVMPSCQQVLDHT